MCVRDSALVSSQMSILQPKINRKYVSCLTEAEMYPFPPLKPVRLLALEIYSFIPFFMGQSALDLEFWMLNSKSGCRFFTPKLGISTRKGEQWPGTFQP